MPVAFTSFEYEGKEYSVWIDGSDPSRRVGDDLPVDKGRKLPANLGAVPICAALIGLIIVASTAGFAAIGWPSYLGFAISVLYGLARGKSIVGHSKAIRNSILASKQSNSANFGSSSLESLEGQVSANATPKMPFLANTRYDAVLIPIISLCFLACGFRRKSAGYSDLISATVPI